MKYFYSDLIKIETIIAELNGVGYTPEQRMHLASLLDCALHYTILDVILSYLGEEDKKIFILRMKEDPQDKKIFSFLKERNQNLEEEIKKMIDIFKKQLIADIWEIR